MKKRALSLFLTLCLMLALLPVQAAAAEPTGLREDTSLQYEAFRSSLGQVYDLNSSSNPPQALDYTVPSGGVTILVFFQANDYRSNAFLRALSAESWAALSQVNLIAVESSQADRAAVQSYLQTVDTNGVIDKVYYNPDSDTLAYWYYVFSVVRVVGMKGMDDLQSRDDLIQALVGKRDPDNPFFPFYVVLDQQNGRKMIQTWGSSQGVFSLRDYLRDEAKIPINGIQTEPVITFDPNGGSVSPTSLTTKDGYLPSLPAAERSGYTHQGWWTAPTGGTRITDKTVFRQDTTLYAHWSEMPSGSITYQQSGDLNTPKMSREEVLRLASSTLSQSLPQQKFTAEPSWTAPYAAGAANPAVLQLAVDRLNAYRRMAGVPAVALDSTLSNQAQHAAVLIAKHGSASHFPSQPSDMDSAFYQTAVSATGTSNLAAGGVSPLSAIDAWMIDPKTDVGHRFWMIHPNMGKAGFGYVYTDSRGNYVAGKVQDQSGRGCDYDFISWPASGYFPDTWFNTSQAWSVHLNSKKYRNPKREDVVVRVSSEKTGKTWTFSQQNLGKSDTQYFTVAGTTTYGMDNGILFLPLGLDELDGVYNVTIGGLTDSNNNSTSLSYQVNFVHEQNVHTVTFDPNEGSCDTACAVTSSRGLLAALPEAAREGYTFRGWGTSPNSVNSISASMVFTQNTTLYALWTPEGANGYKVNLTNSTNGTLNITSDRVKEGKYATVTAHPDAGYEVTSFIVTDKNGKQISTSKITITSNGPAYPSYSFLMPGSDVTVTAVFSKAGTQKYTVRVGNYTNGTVIAPSSAVKAGETVTVYVHPKEHYALTSLTVTGGGGKAVSAAKVSDVAYSFTMPDTDVTVNVAFHPVSSPEEPAKTYTVSTGSNPNGTVVVPSSPVKEGETVAVYAHPKENYELASLTVTGSDGKPVSAAKTSDTSYSFPMPGTDVTVTAVFRQTSKPEVDPAAAKYAVRVGSYSNGTVIPPASAVKAGETVVVYAYPKANYELSSVTVTSGSGRQIDTAKRSSTSYAFTMPEDEVTVNVVFRQASTVPDALAGSYAVRVGSYSNGTVIDPPSSVKEGERVVVYAYPKENYALSSVTVTSGSGKQIPTTKVSDTSYSFPMPGDPVTVNVVFRPAQTASETPSSTPKFTDVPSGQYYSQAVQWAVANDITSGTSPTTFSPNGSCTRAQMVTFLWRAAGSPTYTGTTQFSDVPSGSYYSDAVLWAVKNGITTGTSPTAFSPNGPLNRAQTVTFLYRLAGTPPCTSASRFTDVNAGAYYADAVDWAVANDITNGTSATTFSPDGSCTRGQIVTFLWRYMG